MHFSTAFTVALAAVASASTVSRATSQLNTPNVIEKRGCYSGGEAWGNERGKAQDSARAACQGTLGNRIYDNRETRSACYNLNGGKRAEFQVRHLHNVARFISTDECVDGLLKEINGCGNGGETEYTNWWYRSDPNFGQC